MATRFGRTVGGNWNSATAWSTTSGGAADVPGGLATGDDVVIDAASAGATFTNNTAISLNSLDCNGHTGSLVQSAAVNQVITGDDSTAPGGVTVRLPNGAGGTFSPVASSTITFQHANASKTSTFFSSGKTCANVTLNITDAGNASKVLLGDNLALVANTGALTVTDGYLDYNNKNISSGTLVCSGAAVRTLTPGSATHTITTISGTPVFFGTNVTISANTATLDAVAVATASRTFAMNPTANGNFNNFSISNAALNAQLIQFQTNSYSIAGNTTFGNVRNIVVLGGISMTFATAPTWTGPSSSTPGSLATNGTAGSIVITSGTVSVDWIYIMNFAFTGNWTSLNSFSAGLATGANLTISAPSVGGGGGARFMGG